MEEYKVNIKKRHTHDRQQCWQRWYSDVVTRRQSQQWYEMVAGRCYLLWGVVCVGVCVGGGVEVWHLYEVIISDLCAGMCVCVCVYGVSSGVDVWRCEFVCLCGGVWKCEFLIKLLYVMYVCVCRYIYACMYVCVCVCVCVFRYVAVWVYINQYSYVWNVYIYVRMYK